MKRLTDNWFLNPMIDFEYQSYQALGYIQDIKSCFAQWRFFPYLEDLAHQIDQIDSYRLNKSRMEEKLLGDIELLDLERSLILRKKSPTGSSQVAELDEILAFAVERFTACLDFAKAEFSNIACDIGIRPVGIQDEKNERGILLFKDPKNTRCYRYELRSIRRPAGKETYKDLRTQYLHSVSSSDYTDFSQIKWNIIKKTGVYGGINAYLVDVNTAIPYFETVLPVVKTFLLQQSAPNPYQNTLPEG